MSILNNLKRKIKVRISLYHLYEKTKQVTNENIFYFCR